MELIVKAKVSEGDFSEAVIVPFFQGKEHAESALSVEPFAHKELLPISLGDFKGKEGEVLLLYHIGKAKRVLLLGLGKKKDCSAEHLRRAYATAAKYLRGKKIVKVTALVPEVTHAAISVFEGIKLSNYRYDHLRKDSLKEMTSPLEALLLAPVSEKEATELKQLEVVLKAVDLTRDLVNGNADSVNVKALTALAEDLSSRFDKIKTHILDKSKLEKAKLSFILAVNKGATLDPALVILEYQGDPSSQEKTAIVGKGITYDTGGLNLKPTGSMETMKCDMAGSAAVLGVMQAAAELKLKKNLIGVLAIAENAIGPLSYKPGDVIVGHAGKTVEVNNTDAEGRLVLADALSYIQAEYKPTEIIDLATLTGGIVVALGEDAAGLFSNDDSLAERLMKSGDKTYERLWRMPLYPEYREMLKSHIADMKNSAGRNASAATGAMFLKEFIKEVPWAHLDIAGTAYISDAKKYHPTSATGFGVRLLLDFLKQ